jgi:hypothetical protein
MKKEKKDMPCTATNRFEIDFGQFVYLVRYCSPPRIIGEAAFWDDLINKHYHVLTENERQRLFSIMNRYNPFEHSLAIGNKDCELFNARFDKDNQYKAKTLFEGEEKIVDCFKFEGKYHVSKSRHIEDKYIVEILK